MKALVATQTHMAAMARTVLHPMKLSQMRAAAGRATPRPKILRIGCVISHQCCLRVHAT